MKKIKDFIEVYRKYRRHHPIKYSAGIAFGIAFRGLPF